MSHSLRRTATPLHLVYAPADGGHSVMGRRFMLDVEGSELTLSVDLTLNLVSRAKPPLWQMEVDALLRNHARLRAMQCDDNLVRTRLVRAWEDMQEPKLKVLLHVGERGSLLYAVRPQLRFMGGVQLDVLQTLEMQIRRGSPAAEAA